MIYNKRLREYERETIEAITEAKTLSSVREIALKVCRDYEESDFFCDATFDKLLSKIGERVNALLDSELEFFHSSASCSRQLLISTHDAIGAIDAGVDETPEYL